MYKKRFVMIILCLIICVLPGMALAENTHTTGDHTGWTVLTSDMTSISESGNYYLAEDVVVAGGITVSNGAEVNLCLCGHMLQAPENLSGAFISLHNATLNLYDCNNEAVHEGYIHYGNGGVIWVAGKSDEGETTYNISGGIITRNYAPGEVWGTGINLQYNSMFNMYGGNIAGCDNGVTLINASTYPTFNLYGGRIVGNAKTGVYVWAGEFNMTGGSIDHNAFITRVARGNGGVRITGGRFTMSGGKISGNNSDYGGGVHNSATFIMTGGEITGNRAYAADGGGGVNNVGTFIMTGGSITGNFADYKEGGVGLSSRSEMYVSGSPVINNNSFTYAPPTGNPSAQEGNQNNVYLPAGKTITIGTDLDNDGVTEYLTGGSIGVTSEAVPTTVFPVDVSEKNSADYSSFFTSDNDAYYVTNSGSGSSQVVQLLGKGGTPAPVLQKSYCYIATPELNIKNYDVLAGAEYKLYVWNQSTSKYEYSAQATDSMEMIGEDTVMLGEGLAEKMAITATLPGVPESAMTEFSVRMHDEKQDWEDIEEVLPPQGEDETAPAEIIIYGPDTIIRSDPDVAPEVEIKKYDDIEDFENYEELKEYTEHGFANNNKQNYAYYEISLKNADIKEDAEIEVSFYFGTEYKNKTVWVLHLCSKHDKIEKHEDLKVNEEGYVTIKVHSFSPFIIGLYNTPDMPISSGRSSGTDLKYNGGNSFSTSKSAVPTSVEIDGVPVSFSGDGRNFTVDCIDANARQITVRWHSTSVTVNFTPDSSAVCGEISIPKTGDVTVLAYAAMSAMAAAAVMGGKR